MTIVSASIKKMFYKRTAVAKPSSSPPASENAKEGHRRRRMNFESSWNTIQEGINKLIEYLDSNLTRPFNHAEYSSLYS